MNKNVLNFKLILIGDTSVGKTSLMYKYTKNEFPEQFQSTIGIDTIFKNITYKGFKINVRIYDTAGQEKYRSIIKNYFKGSNGVFVFFDLTNKKSFDNLNSWIKDIDENIDNKDYKFLILGNKNDLINIHQVSDNDIAQFEKNNGFKIIKTSARTGDGVKEAFEQMFDQIMDNKSEEIIYKEFCSNYDKKILLKNNKVKSSNVECC